MRGMPIIPEKAFPERGGLPLQTGENLAEARLAKALTIAYQTLQDIEAWGSPPTPADRKAIMDVFDEVKFEDARKLDLIPLAGKDIVEMLAVVNQLIGKRLEDMATSEAHLERLVGIYPPAFEHYNDEDFQEALARAKEKEKGSAA